MKERDVSCQSIVNQLIAQVREGNQAAFAELLKIYEPLFLSLLSNPDATGELNDQDVEDLRQELSVVFFHAILSYDLKQDEVQFGLYAKICMRNAMITQLRKLQKRKSPIPLEENGEEDFFEIVGGENPPEEVADSETVETMNKRIESVLSPFEIKVWQMYLTGNGTKNISLALGKSEKSIENAIFRLRRKLRDLFRPET